MADLKISQLSAATALAGTEVVPVVQGGATKKATIDQILAPASGKGINFAAAGGDILSMYDEGTFTPTIIGMTTAGTGTYSVQEGRYTRIGNRVLFSVRLSWSAHTGTGNMRIAGLPFTVANMPSVVSVWNSAITLDPSSVIQAYAAAFGTQIALEQYPAGGGGANTVALDTAGAIMVSGHYEA